MGILAYSTSFKIVIYDQKLMAKRTDMPKIEAGNKCMSKKTPQRIQLTLQVPIANNCTIIV